MSPPAVAIKGCLKFARAVQTKECCTFKSLFPKPSQGSAVGVVGILTTPPAGRSGVHIPAGVGVFALFQNVQSGSGALLASCSVGTGLFLGDQVAEA